MGQTLADLGADVIKVEAPEGDETRRWGPPFVHGADGAQADAAYFHCCNRGKRSVIADFRSARDLDLVRRLIDRSDIVIENFKTGALQKFGLDYASVRPRNPRLIYCSVTGFGQDGPYCARAGYDAMIQAMSGIMDITGDPDGEPQKIGVALADILTGVYGVVAIQAALAARERTGEGQQIDMALFDVMVGVLANQALNYFVSGTTPHRIGNAHPNIVPYQTFPTSDGHVMVAVGSDSQFVKLCSLLGRPDLAADERLCHQCIAGSKPRRTDSGSAPRAQVLEAGRAFGEARRLGSAGGSHQHDRGRVLGSPGPGTRNAHRLRPPRYRGRQAFRPQDSAAILLLAALSHQGRSAARRAYGRHRARARNRVLRVRRPAMARLPGKDERVEKR